MALSLKLRMPDSVRRVLDSPRLAASFRANYPPVAEVVYTTGTTTAGFTNGAPKIGTGMMTQHGQTFECAAWTMENGPGKLAGGFLFEEVEQAGDVANVNVLDD